MSEETVVPQQHPTANIPVQPLAPQIESMPWHPAPDTGAKSRRPHWWSLAAGLAVGLLVLGTIWVGTSGLLGGTMTLNGTMTLYQSSSSSSYSSYSSYSYLSSNYSLGANGTCYGQSGYNDIAQGTAVNVYDGAGKLLAIGQLGPGQYSSTGLPSCAFSFSVPDVPSGETFYQVEVSHRGKLNYTADQIETGQVSVTLGS